MNQTQRIITNQETLELWIPKTPCSKEGGFWTRNRYWAGQVVLCLSWRSLRYRLVLIRYLRLFECLFSIQIQGSKQVSKLEEISLSKQGLLWCLLLRRQVASNMLVLKIQLPQGKAAFLDLITTLKMWIEITKGILRVLRLLLFTF